MKLQEIKSQSAIDPKQLYNRLNCARLTDTCREEAKLSDFKNLSRKIVRYAIDEICRAHKRNNEMDEEDRESLVSRILSRRSYFTLEDIKLFADMLISGEIVTGEGQNRSAKLISVDEGSIMEKLVAFDAMRNDALAKIEQEKQEFEATFVPVGEEYNMTHEDFARIKEIVYEEIDETLEKYRELWCKYTRKMYQSAMNGKESMKAYYARARFGYYRAFNEWCAEVSDNMEHTIFTRIE